MIIIHEIGFVLLILSPLLLAGTVVAIFRQPGSRFNYRDGILIALPFLAVTILFPPFSVGESYYRLVLTTALALILYGGVLTQLGLGWRWAGFFSFPIYFFLAFTFLWGDFSSGYRDNRRHPYMQLRQEMTEDFAQDIIKSSPAQTYPAMAVTADAPILQALTPEACADFVTELPRWGYNWRIMSRWHTPITGMYRVKQTPAVLWYPGGRVKDAAPRMRWREAL